MNINLTKTSFGFAAIASVLAMSGAARAADQGSCATYKPELPHVYVTGSSAVVPFVQAIADAVKESTIVVYVKQTSCKGVSALTANEDLPTGAGLGVLGTTDTCTAAAATKADIGATDVFATSCPNVTAKIVSDAGLADFQGPIQAMNFIVPKAAFDNGVKSISAEAAYLVFGFDPAAKDAASAKAYGTGTPWLSMDNIWVRDDTSGTQTMLGAAINVPAASWKASNYTDATPQIHGKGLSSGNVASFVGNSTTPDSTIGILASTDLNTPANVAKLRGLAFQGYGQTCGYWPDATAGSGDFANVRSGKYAVWGPIHFLAKAKADGSATSADVANLIAYINSEMIIPGGDVTTIVEVEQSKGNVVPQCAMSVKRNAEVSASGGDSLESVAPSCGCYYDSLVLGAANVPASCVTCDNEGEKCAGDKSLTCSFGYCEAI
jgi:hypothetical protein